MTARFALILVAAFALVRGAAAQGPLVDASWLAANLEAPGVVALDIRADRKDYERAHVPGAIHSSYARDGWRVTGATGTPDMLPGPSALGALIGGLGIGNDDHVVVVAAGTSAADMSSATRVYWSFRMASHAKVSVLDGGMAAWSADPMSPVEAGERKRQAQLFKVTPLPRLVASRADVQHAIGARAPLADIRPSDQYLGVNKTAKVARRGTLPGAVNLPDSWLTQDNGGKFRSAAALRKLVASAGVPVDGDVIAFCNTGQLGSIGWFVLSEILGNPRARLYDGSMVEWAADPAAPIVVKIDSSGT
ncbi:MAG: sulfurtransferase [Alphaproteobacteria bacterium]|nr:sulfurtransferase [Alphaproteobacteria bacterium]